MYLHNNGGLLAMTPYGMTLLTDGPDGRGLDFNSDIDFINTGVINQDDNFMNLFFGWFNATVSGSYQFRNAGDDDRCGIWLDLNQNGVFESSVDGLGSDRGEQLSWEDPNPKTVSLTAGMSYMFAVTHGEIGGASSIDVRFKTPGGNEVVIKPTDPAQDGMWSASIELLLLTPNGGERLTVGSRCLIIWQSLGTISNVFIEYSTNNGGTWAQVDPPNTGNSGSYDWSVPEVSSNQCLVRISDTSDPSVFDTSEAVFSIIPRALVSHWKLDETSGSTASDSAGDNHGTLKPSSPPLWQPAGGRLDGALEFDGLDDYVLISNEENFDITHTITLAAWIKVKAFDNAWQAIVTKGDNAWRLQRDASNNGIEFACTGINVPGTTWGNILGSVDVNDGQWHHIAGVYDGTKIYLYVDGVVDNFNDASGFINRNNFPVMIGENAQERGRYWNGLIDDVRIYNYGLNASEISQLCKLEMIYYVDDDATGANNGTSWMDAYTDLQSALTTSFSGDQIWVAEGTYKPTVPTPPPPPPIVGYSSSKDIAVTAGGRTATFQLINGVSIYGGFPSGGGAWGDRDPDAFETILSGDIFGDDMPNFVNNNENSYHVVNGSGTDETAILDGFIITGGNANDPNFHEPNSYGGGMYNNSGSPTVTNCTFSENLANYGGGMHNDQSSPKVTNCTFSGNKANNRAGGMDNDKASPTVINCIFIANYGGSGGGGMDNYMGSPTVINCIFRGNSASEGGGMANNSSPTVINCTFTGNSAGLNGGGMANFVSSPMVTNCSFNGNSAYYRGGGMLNDYSGSPTLTNCILWGNTAVDGPQIALKRNSSVTISYCDMQSGQTAIDNDGTGSINWGTGNIDAEPNFVRNAYDGGDGWGVGDNDDFGDLHLQPGSPCVDTGNNDADIDVSTPEIDPLPDTDLDSRSRFTDGDCNDTNTVDMGAYEFTYTYTGDFDIDCDVDFADFSIFAGCWFTDELLADIAPTPAGDGIIDQRDLNILCNNWLFGK
jgi:hypothetical protein